MARTDPQVNLRIPAALKEKLEAASVANSRSITAEVVARLEASFEKGDAEGVVDFLLRETKHLSAKLDLVMNKLEGKTPPPGPEGVVEVIKRKR